MNQHVSLYVYGALARLEERGLIEAVPGDLAQPRHRSEATETVSLKNSNEGL